MSRRYFRRLLLVLLLAVLAGPRHASAQERTASERYANAIHKASGLTATACQAIEGVLASGWPSGNAASALGALLHANLPSLAELRRGAALPTCALYPGTNVFDRTSDDIGVLFTLARLCGVDALYAVHQGLEARAARDVETVFGVGRHAATDRALAVRLQGLALVRLGCMLAERLRTRAARDTVGSTLSGYSLPSTREVAVAEKATYLDAVDYASRDLPWLRPTLLAVAPRIGAELYDPLIAACSGKGPDESGAVEQGLRGQSARMKQAYGDVTIGLVAERAKAAGLRGDALADELCLCIACRVWPDLASYARALDETMAALEALRKKLPGRAHPPASYRRDGSGGLAGLLTVRGPARRGSRDRRGTWARRETTSMAAPRRRAIRWRAPSQATALGCRALGIPPR